MIRIPSPFGPLGRLSRYPVRIWHRRPAGTVAALLAATCAFLGSLMSSDATLTGAIWVGLAFLLLLAATSVYIYTSARRRIIVRAFKREVEFQQRELRVGHKANNVYLGVLDTEGHVKSASLAQLCIDAPYDGSVLAWEHPMLVTLTYYDTKEPVTP